MSALSTGSVAVPLVTPLGPDGHLDPDSLRQLIDFVLGAGAAGLLVLGSCGESAALGVEDRRLTARVAIEHARDRAHVMLGVPTVGTPDAVAEAVEFDRLGAHSVLVTAPTGLELSDDELLKHYDTIRGAVSASVLAYDVPGRVTVRLGPQLISRLAHEGLIAGVKDSTCDLGDAHRIVDLTRDINGFVRLTGSEECIDSAMLAGYEGAVPGLANVFPQLHVALMNYARAGDWPRAAEIQAQIVPLLDLYDAPIDGASFSARSLAALKLALVELGVIATATTSHPFTPPDDAARAHSSYALARGIDVLASAAIGRTADVS